MLAGHIDGMENSERHPTRSEYVRGLAHRLRMLRESQGLTQEDVASRAGIAPYTYQQYEKGESKRGAPMNPTLSSLLALADAFQIDVRELLSIDFDASGDDGWPNAV